jgi:hypothetical protein
VCVFFLSLSLSFVFLAKSLVEMYEVPTPLSPPPNPYDIRALEDQRAEALNTWANKSKMMCGFQLTATVLMLYSPFWYLQFIGLVVVAVGLFGAFKARNEVFFFCPPTVFVSFFVLIHWGFSCPSAYWGGHFFVLQFIFLYLVLSLLAIGKDAVVIYLYLRSPPAKGYDIFVIIMSFVDALCIQPFSAYYGFYHFQSLKTNLTFEKMSDTA